MACSNTGPCSCNGMNQDCRYCFGLGSVQNRFQPASLTGSDLFRRIVAGFTHQRHMPIDDEDIAVLTCHGRKHASRPISPKRRCSNSRPERNSTKAKADKKRSVQTRGAKSKEVKRPATQVTKLGKGKVAPKSKPTLTKRKPKAVRKPVGVAAKSAKANPRKRPAATLTKSVKAGAIKKLNVAGRRR